MDLAGYMPYKVLRFNKSDWSADTHDWSAYRPYVDTGGELDLFVYTTADMTYDMLRGNVGSRYTSLQVITKPERKLLFMLASLCPPYESTAKEREAKIIEALQSKYPQVKGIKRPYIPYYEDLYYNYEGMEDLDTRGYGYVEPLSCRVCMNALMEISGTGAYEDGILEFLFNPNIIVIGTKGLDAWVRYERYIPKACFEYLA